MMQGGSVPQQQQVAGQMGYMMPGGCVAQHQVTEPMGYMMHGGSVAHQQHVVPMMPMMPMVVAMIPTAMPVPVMAGMQPVSVGSPPQPVPHAGMTAETPPEASPPGPFASPASSPSSDDTPLPAGGKTERRLEDLLPRGRRPTSTRENLGRKVFVGGLHPFGRRPRG